MARKRPSVGRVLQGGAGTATEVLQHPKERRWPASVASWLLRCPGQSPAWEHYALDVVHLREVPGAPAPVVSVPGATHEVILAALDPELQPEPTNPVKWSRLHPLNAVEQVQLPDDDAAVGLLAMCAQAVVDGILPAEPPLSGQVEPWRSTLIKSAAHLRGEEHAP